MPIQLTLIAQAATAATRAAAFPAMSDTLDPSSAAKATALAASIRRVDAAWVSPARAARQTIDALGLTATEVPALRDLEVGSWAGRTMEDVTTADPAAFAAWITDPAAIPHGGESIVDLIARTAAWLRGLDLIAARVVAVAHASTLRAAILLALGAPPTAFWRIDVAPLYHLRLNGAGSVWTLRSIGP